MSCDEYISYNHLNKFFAISCYIKMSIVIIFFTYLFIVLTRNWCSKKGSLGGLPILVCGFVVVCGVSEIVHAALVTCENGYFNYYKAQVVAN